MATTEYDALKADTAVAVADVDVNEQEKERKKELEIRRNVLASYDEAEFSWFHVRAILVSGIGFFTDSYDLFAINIVLSMIGYAYYSSNDNAIPSDIDGIVKGAAPVGTLIGQLVFGFLSDILGRKKMYGVELIIMIVATVGSALSANWVNGRVSVLGMLTVWRFLVGLGIGGDYPLSAIITSEFSSVRRRGMMISAVFAMQGVGILVAAIFSAIVLACFQQLIEEDATYVDYAWRLVLAFGVVPATIAIYYRLTLPETPRFTMEVQQDIDQAAKDVARVITDANNNTAAGASDRTPLLDAPQQVETNGTVAAKIQTEQAPAKSKGRAFSVSNFFAHFSQWKNLKVLLGTSISWFVLDVAFYGINLNQSLIIKAIGFDANNGSAFDKLWKIATGNLIITCMGTFPGYWVTVATIEQLGRTRIQMMGFIILTVIFFVLGSKFDDIKESSSIGLIALFTLAQFFFNFGPNATTFVIPGEVFPTRYRSTCHGISAASGKAGAILATYAFSPLKDIGGKDAFLPQLLLIFGGFMAMGIFSTLLVPETANKTLEELSGDDDEAKVASKEAAVNSA